MKLAKVSEENLKTLSDIKQLLGFSSIDEVISDMIVTYREKLKEKSR